MGRGRAGAKLLEERSEICLPRSFRDSFFLRSGLFSPFVLGLIIYRRFGLVFRFWCSVLYSGSFCFMWFDSVLVYVERSFLAVTDENLVLNLKPVHVVFMYSP